MFGTIRDFHDLTNSLTTIQLSQETDAMNQHHFQSLDSNANHAGVIGHAGKDGFPRPFGPDFKKGYIWYDNESYWDHRLFFQT